MVEEIHFNDAYPEYHNIYISDKRSGEAIIYDGSGYKTVYAEDAVEELDMKMKSHITDRFYIVEGLLHNREEFEKKYSDREKTLIEKRLRILNDYEEDSAEQKRVNQEIKYVLCDKKELIKETRRNVERKRMNRRLASRQELRIE
jgi:hypothetical protein